MQQLTQYIRQISAAQFAAIVLLFFLPFVEVSCSTMIVIDVSGQQLATGGKPTVVSQPNFPGMTTTPGATPAPATGPAATPATTPGANAAAHAQDNVDEQPSALIAWILAAVGIVVSLVAGRTFRMIAAGVGVAGAVCLFWLKSAVEGNVLNGMSADQAAQLRAFIQINFLFAFWLCVILFLTAAATNVYAIMKERSAAPPKT